MNGDLDARTRALIAGKDDLALIVRTDTGDLLAGGGIEQRRTIAAFDIAQQAVHVSEDFSPAPSPAQRFRMRGPMRVRRASADGTRGAFIWDSADLREGGGVQFRIVPMDAEVGLDDATEAARQVRSPLDSSPVVVSSPDVTDRLAW